MHLQRSLSLSLAIWGAPQNIVYNNSFSLYLFRRSLVQILAGMLAMLTYIIIDFRL
jgi:hypothetical protein